MNLFHWLNKNEYCQFYKSTNFYLLLLDWCGGQKDHSIDPANITNHGGPAKPVATLPGIHDRSFTNFPIFTTSPAVSPDMTPTQTATGLIHVILGSVLIVAIILVIFTIAFVLVFLKCTVQKARKNFSAGNANKNDQDETTEVSLLTVTSQRS